MPGRVDDWFSLRSYLGGRMMGRRKLGDPQRIKRNIILDVGGERFIASRDILESFPGTR